MRFEFAIDSLRDCNFKIKSFHCQSLIVVFVSIIMIQEVLPIARRLGESVLESCATKLRPYLKQAVNTLDISLDDYSNVLASICQDTSGNLEQNDASITSDHVVIFLVLLIINICLAWKIS